MTYIILELFPKPSILTDIDGEIWETDLETAQELAAECQEGMVVPLDKNLMEALWDCWSDEDETDTTETLNSYFDD